MGSERTKKLYYWRNKIEENENDKITNAVNYKYNILKNEVSLKWNGVENNYNQTIAPLNIKFKIKEAEIIENKNRLIQTKEAEINKIKLKFDKLHINIKNEFITTLNKFYTDIENIYGVTKNALLNNFSIYENKFKSKLLEVQQSNQSIETELKKYNSLSALAGVQ